MTGHPLPPHVQAFFTDRLINQLGASPNTVAGYRDTFRLLLKFAERDAGKRPTDLLVEDVDAGLVGRFLDHLECERRNSARTRNVRLTAIRSFFGHVSRCEPALLEHCRQVLAMPSKRFEQRTVEWLDEKEIKALVAAPDVATRQGRRDRALLLLMVQTGIRVSELTGLDRSTPLREDAAAALREWMEERGGDDGQPLFPSNRNRRLSRDAVACIVRKHVAAASRSCPSLRKRRISTHCLRHAAAMTLLREEVPITIIALWLGHQSVESTMKYLHADPKIKERAMERTRPVDVPPGRYQPEEQIMAFLESL